MGVTSGSFDTAARVSGSYNTKARFSWSQTGQSVDGNYTDISWTLTGVTASQYQWIHIYGIEVIVNGVNQGVSWSGDMYNGTRMASGTCRIYHGADGTKTFSASAKIQQYSTAASSWYSGSGSWTLNTIPRASTPSLANSTFNIGDTITVNTNRASSSFTHTISITYGSTTTQIATGVGASVQYNTANIANAMYAVIPNATSFTGTITCVTYSGSTNVGTKTCSYTAKAVESVAKPTFSNFTYADTNSTITGITGNNQILVQGKSTLRVTIASANKATANKSATMNSYLSTISGLSASANYSTSDVNMAFSSSAFTAGSQTLSVKATDSRGYSTTMSKAVTVLAYANPVINATATRLNNFENTTTLVVQGSYSPLTVDSTAKNTVTSVQYRYKSSSTSTWGSWVTMSGLSPTAAGVYTTTNATLNLDNNTSYNIEVKTTDRIGSTTVSLTVPVGIPIFRIGTDGYVYNQEKRLITVDETPRYSTHVGQVIMSTALTTAAQVANVYGGTWEAWGKGRVPVGVDPNDTDFNAANKTGGSKTVTLQLSQIPAHGHMMGQTYSGWKLSGNGNGPAGLYTGYGLTDRSKNEGGSGAHDNLQPYITIYMWRRIA